MTARSTDTARKRRRSSAREREVLLGRAIVALAREPEHRRHDLGDILDSVLLEELVGLAYYHRLPGLAYERFTERGVKGPLIDELGAGYRDSGAHHLALLAEVAGLSRIFSECDIPWLVVKGPVLAELSYSDPGLRSSLDLDIVVRPEDLGAALAAVEAGGGMILQRNWPLLERLRLGQIVVRLPLGSFGDIHWHLVNTPFARDRYRLVMSELFDRRRRVWLGPLEVDTLDEIDSVLHLCLHAALSGGHLLVWLKDIEQSLSRGGACTEPDWDVLVERSHRYRLNLVAAVMLERTRLVLDAAIPAEVIETLAPKSPLVRLWSSWDRGPPRAWSGLARTGKTLLTATASTTGSTLAELARRAPVEIALPEGRALLDRLCSRDASSRPQLIDDRGGGPARADYLATIGVEARLAESRARGRVACGSALSGLRGSPHARL